MTKAKTATKAKTETSNSLKEAVKPDIDKAEVEVADNKRIDLNDPSLSGSEAVTDALSQSKV